MSAPFVHVGHRLQALAFAPAALVFAVAVVRERRAATRRRTARFTTRGRRHVRPRLAESRRETTGRSLAQTFCLVCATLVAVGVLGFVFGGTNFDKGGAVQGDELIVFEVNGWHNLVHIASGLLLLAASPNGPLAAKAAIAFGLVAVWGFFDGNDVFGLIPANTADNFLHLVLTVAALFAGFTSRGLMTAGAAHRTRREQRPAI